MYVELLQSAVCSALEVLDISLTLRRGEGNVMSWTWRDCSAWHAHNRMTVCTLETMACNIPSRMSFVTVMSVPSTMSHLCCGCSRAPSGRLSQCLLGRLRTLTRSPKTPPPPPPHTSRNGADVSPLTLTQPLHMLWTANGSPLIWKG